MELLVSHTAGRRCCRIRQRSLAQFLQFLGFGALKFLDQSPGSNHIGMLLGKTLQQPIKLSLLGLNTRINLGR